MLSKKRPLISVIAAMAAFSVISSVLPRAIAAEHLKTTQPATTQSVAAPSRLDNVLPAWAVAKTLVQDRLTSPSTANFGHQEKTLESLEDIVLVVKSEAETKDDINSKWYRPGTASRWFQVEGWVDAQNQFGATVRNYFTCSLIYYAPLTPNADDIKSGKAMLQPDRWKLRSFEFNLREDLLFDRIRHMGPGEPKSLAEKMHLRRIQKEKPMASELSGVKEDEGN